MRILTQLLVVVALGAAAAPLAARFLPASHPWLDRVGLLQPMTAAGLVPEAEEDTPRGPGRGGLSEVAVIALPPGLEPLRETVEAIGTAEGARSVSLSFGVSGRIASLPVTSGEFVEAGDLIAELDAESARLLVARAALDLEGAQATIDRLDLLAQTGNATDLQRQDAELALRAARLGLQSAERDLADHQLTAPIAGHLGLMEAQVGDLVSPSTAVTRIEDRTSLIVDFRVPERIAARVAAGDVVTASPVADPELQITGEVIAVDNMVDEVSRTLRVRASIPNPEDGLRAGMALVITLDFVGAETPAVDPMAIQWGNDGAYLWVVREAAAERLPIRILQRNALSVLVDAAFEPGDLVIVEGLQTLRPGTAVTLAQPRS